MATLRSEATCLRITPLKLTRRPGSDWCWKHYEFSVTIFREDGKDERELPLFNSELLENPFIHSVDTNSLSTVFNEALTKGKIAHYNGFEEMNIFVLIYPDSEAYGAVENQFMIIFQIQENTFSRAGYTRGGPALVLYIDSEELKRFCERLIEEEKEAFIKNTP